MEKTTMTNRYICVPCRGDTCPRCQGRGWVGEILVQIERRDSLAEAIAKHLVEKEIAAVGVEEWTRRASEAKLTVEQFTEIETWQASGPVKQQMKSVTQEVIDAVADLVGIEVPPVFSPEPARKYED